MCVAKGGIPKHNNRKGRQIMSDETNQVNQAGGMNEAKQGKGKGNEILAEHVREIIPSKGLKNMTQLAIQLGAIKKGQSVSGSFTKRLKELVPEINDLFKAVAPVKAEKAAGKPVKATKTTKTTKATESKGKVSKAPKAIPIKPIKPVKEPKSKAVKGEKAAKVVKGSGNQPRHERNPFRAGSSYATVFDVFAMHPEGIRRDELLTKVSAAIGKDLKHAAYDLAVILSAKDSNTGERHRSCREGFWVKRENDHLTLMID